MELCMEKCIHEEVVESVAGQLPAGDKILQLADMFKALSDPSRLRIVTALLFSELCVCDLSVIGNLSESAVSHQLRILRNLKIVSTRREGKIIFYRLTDEHVRQLVCNSLDHVVEEGCGV